MEFEKVREILAELLGVEKESVTPDSRLTDDLGADSLDLFQLLMRLEEEYDIETDDRLLDEIITVGDVARAIRDR